MQDSFENTFYPSEDIAMKRTLLVLISMLIVAAFGSAAAPGSANRKVHLDEPFTIKVKEKVVVKDAKLKIKFASVPTDSRCPEGVQCVWQGNAEVKLKSGGSQPISLNTGVPPSQVEVGAFTIKLLQLAPHPKQGVEIPRGDYQATLIVSRR